MDRYFPSKFHDVGIFIGGRNPFGNCLEEDGMGGMRNS
jgi:hypothetical protein